MCPRNGEGYRHSDAYYGDMVTVTLVNDSFNRLASGADTILATGTAKSTAKFVTIACNYAVDILYPNEGYNQYSEFNVISNKGPGSLLHGNNFVHCSITSSVFLFNEHMSVGQAQYSGDCYFYGNGFATNERSTRTHNIEHLSKIYCDINRTRLFTINNEGDILFHLLISLAFLIYN